MQSALKLLCQALLEKEEIKDDDKNTFSDFLSSFEFNCYILGKVLANWALLETNLEYIEKKTLTVDLTLKEFDSNTVKIQNLKGWRAKLIKELQALDKELKILETDQGVMQEELQVLNTELDGIPSKHEESILRQKFIISHSKSFTRFWDNFRLEAQGLGKLV